jgi:hypothetical protein
MAYFAVYKIGMREVSVRRDVSALNWKCVFSYIQGKLKKVR